ncbi:MAG TPA: glycosyltransferase family 39 protein [Anaeromyxobacteraceae bacterium]|nr:glycosyltransferase family 39 protein [Anaeromyxobacteraceae bacterium]
MSDPRPPSPSVTGLLGRWRALPEEPRGIALVAAAASLVVLPWLGAVGLWDPWEPHYGEVAREMLVRRDFVHPYYELAWFFSKPVLLMWLTAAAMALAGAQSRGLPVGSVAEGPTPSGLSLGTEWAMRLPVALLSILACALVFVAVRRLVSRRAAYASSLALATMPFWFLMARQAITDMPFVALMTSGAMCFAVALWDDRAHGRAWAYAGYAFLAFATLAKGLLGFALAGAAFLAWFVFTGEWRLLRRLRLAERIGGVPLPIGPAIFLAIAAPWYVVLSLFHGVDDEGKTFAYRFWIHDHVKRLGEGVHTTTPGGTFDYFIRELGLGTFPWAAALPGALADLAGVRLKGRTRRDDLVLFAGLWAVLTYVLMSFSATKFHHYIFPAVPALAILCGAFLDRVMEDGLEAHAGALLLGLAAYAVVAHSLWMEPKALPDLYVYNYDRPYPEKELADLHPGTRLGPFTLSMGAKPVISALGAAGAVALVAAWLWRSRRGMAAALGGIAAAFAIWVSWFHWRELSPHWSQRDMFRTYLAERRSPDEPIVAYYMNWKGETFYSRNLVRQVQDNGRMKEVAARPGPLWVLVERGRFNNLKSAVGPAAKLRIADRSTNKFWLVEVTDAAPAATAPPALAPAAAPAQYQWKPTLSSP